MTFLLKVFWAVRSPRLVNRGVRKKLRAKVYRTTRPIVRAADDGRSGITLDTVDCLAAVGVIPCAPQHEILLRKQRES